MLNIANKSINSLYTCTFTKYYDGSSPNRMSDGFMTIQPFVSIIKKSGQIYTWKRLSFSKLVFRQIFYCSHPNWRLFLFIHIECGRWVILIFSRRVTHYCVLIIEHVLNIIIIMHRKTSSHDILLMLEWVSWTNGRVEFVIKILRFQRVKAWCVFGPYRA